MNPADRVRHLVATGALDAAEGERLLHAMGRPARRSGWQLLFDPFERFGGGTAVGAGLLIALASLAFTRLGVRFDGFIDLHLARPSTPLVTSLLEQVVVWILPALLFFVYARLVSRQSAHVRFVDFAGVVGIARAPYLLAAPVGAALFPQAGTMPSGPALAVIVGVTLGALGWMITLLYRGFKHASGLAGTGVVAGFIGMAVTSEVASKVVLSIAPR